MKLDLDAIMANMPKDEENLEGSAGQAPEDPPGEP